MELCSVTRSRDNTPDETVVPIERAFDMLRFGADRILNLRDGLPTAAQAETRVDAWLRRQQAAGVVEVLVITGRGVRSLDGVGKVRASVLRRCTQLKRLNVVASVSEHGPGALIVRVAPLRALVNAPRLRTGRKPLPSPIDPSELGALSPTVRTVLREVATLAIQRLGVALPTEAMIADEMRAQFASLAASVVHDDDRDAALLRVAMRLRQELFEE
jgi:hypothetical protein